MAAIDPRIDAYIDRAEPFAKPILKHLRQLIHQACPNVAETIKWSFPNFEYKGSILCNVAAFKQHASFGFWLGSLLSDPEKILERSGDKSSMGSLGQLRSVGDLPADNILTSYLHEAMSLIDKGTKMPKKPKPAEASPVEIPEVFLDALNKNVSAAVAFEKFSPSQKKEYIQWIAEAKTEATRNKRVATAVEWIAEGKIRNWKYLNC